MAADQEYNMSSSNFDYDVAIIGYGPTSVVAANFLGAAGLSVVIFERDKDLYSRARAVTVDGTTMRIFQSLGLDETVKEDMNVTPFLRWKTYAGKEFMRIKPGGGNWGHANSYMIYQPYMEAKLRKGTERYKNVKIHFGYEVSGLTQDASGVDVTAEPVGSGKSTTVRVKYVIGADGGSSQTRKLIGSVAKGETRERTWIIIDAKVKKAWPEHDILTFWSDADRPAVDIPLTKVHHRWELPLGEKARKEDFASEAQIWDLLSAFGMTDEYIEITHHAFYNHHIRMVDKWRNGRILLAGDAAHLMPPWAGQGMQSGIRDAYSLAWRLRAILKFGLDDALLDSYQVERQPHVEAMTQSAISLGGLIEAKKGPAQVMRNLMMPILSKNPKFANSLAVSPDAKSGWFSAKPEKKNALGQMLPQPHVTLKSGKSVPFDSVYGLDFAVIGYDTDPATAAGADAWKKLDATFVTVRPAGTKATRDGDVVDETGEIGEWMKARGAAIIALRPDRLVAASDNTSLAVPA
jgi:3-(3-hydroxy-phenyl)propionate hydroxylase